MSSRPSLDGRNSISAIEVAPANSKRVYVATENGGFFRSLDGGDTWSPNLSSSVLPGHNDHTPRSHPKDANLVIAAVANFGHSHVFFKRKTAGLTGKTWTRAASRRAASCSRDSP